MKVLRVLVACEFSGVVRDAFLALGHDAYSCDLLRNDSPRHHHQDVRPLLREPWDLVIAHPPCTYLTNFTACMLSTRESNRERREFRLAEMDKAIDFFRECLAANAPRVCVENPTPLGLALPRLGRYTQAVQPWWFGHPFTKRTCLWLRGLPPLRPTDPVKPVGALVRSGTNERGGKRLDGKEGRSQYLVAWRGKKSGYERSVTFSGLAQAMAEQWSESPL